MRTAAIQLRKIGMGFSTFFLEDTYKVVKYITVSQTDDKQMIHTYTHDEYKNSFCLNFIFLIPSISQNVLDDVKSWF